MALIKRISTVCSQCKLTLRLCNSDSTFGRIFTRSVGKISSMHDDDASHHTNIDSAGINKKLMEFFDDKKNWGVNEIRVGRSWCKEELRIKGNTDLHKLWYVLLKEKNMLLTMERESNERMRLFPNPERLDKVKESMASLEEVVRERNRAYHLLETGEDGERPGRLAVNPLGMRYFYRMREHTVPLYRNIRWWRGVQIGHDDTHSVTSFLRLYREKLFLAKKQQRTRNFNHVQHLLRRFPHMDLEAVQKQYPDVSLPEARIGKRAQGNHEFNS